MYPPYTALVLQSMGYDPLVDFTARASNPGGDVTLDWHHTDTQPTEETIAAGYLTAMQGKASAAARAEASRRIAIIQPPSSESRSLRWAAQIADYRSTTHPYPLALPSPWNARETQLRAAGTAIEAIAAASNSMDTEIAALTTVADCEAYIAGIQADTASAPRTVEWP